MAMETRVISVTPELAREWLEHNMKGNRPVQKSTVHSYARQMRCGTWNLTHQGIAFGENGELIDGQHRLHAVVEANVPVRMNVTTGVERTAGEVFTIDVGRKRTYANITQMSGIDDAVIKYCGSYISTYMRFKLPGGRRPEPAEIVDYIERHYDDVKKLYMYCGASSRPHGRSGGGNAIPAIVAAAMLSAIYRGEDNNALYQFGQVYRLNDVSGCNGYNPKHVLNLRDYVRQYKISPEMFERCESAVWAFAHNLARFNIRDNCYPVNVALDQ